MRHGLGPKLEVRRQKDSRENAEHDCIQPGGKTRTLLDGKGTDEGTGCWRLSSKNGGNSSATPLFSVKPKRLRGWRSQWSQRNPPVRIFSEHPNIRENTVCTRPPIHERLFPPKQVRPLPPGAPLTAAPPNELSLCVQPPALRSPFSTKAPLDASGLLVGRNDFSVAVIGINGL